MTFGKWARGLLFAAPFVAGCAGFWQNPNSVSSSNTSFSLSNSGNISVSPGSSNTSTITVTPANSFTGTVNVGCAITSAPSSASSPTTCSVSPTSVSLTSSTAATSTLTATTTASTTAGTYNITVTGTSGSLSATTSLCVEVSTSSGTCTAATPSGVFYVLNQTTNQLVTLSISSTGSLTVVNVTALAAKPLALAVAPSGNFLYISTANGIYVYAIGSTGLPAVTNGGQPISPDIATSMEVDSTNSWLVEGISGSSQIFAININSSNGGLAAAGEQEQPFSLPSGDSLPSNFTQLLAISPGDSSTCNTCYVFIAMGSGGTEMVHFNPSSATPFGTAFHLNPVSSLGGANAVAVDPQNRLLYVGEANAVSSSTNSGGLRALTIGSGGATEISGSPYAIGGTGPSSILPTSDGNFVYIASTSVSGSGNGAIASFSVSSSASALTSVGTVQAGATGLINLAEDSTSTYVLATDASGNFDLEAYTMNAGVLTSVLTNNFGTSPSGAIAVAALP
jgi:6-phosphogluconolactonase